MYFFASNLNWHMKLLHKRWEIKKKIDMYL